MNTPLSPPVTPYHGYDRAALDAYFAAADAERTRLHAAIAHEQARIARARAAIDGQRVLAAMVAQACDEISAKRRQRDLVVQRVAGAADGTAIRWMAPATAPSVPRAHPAAAPSVAPVPVVVR